MMTLAQLLRNLPQRGQVVWLGVRPAKRAPMNTAQEVMAAAHKGLIGDRYANKSGSRQVTLIQAEHLVAVGSMLGTTAIAPERVRRNIVVQGINLLALKDKRFQIGNAVFECSGLCHPCSRMEQTLGEGGYNAMRGHGGITARVVEGGKIPLYAPVFAI